MDDDMFSNVGSIFTTKPREAESTDTRLGIRRHDPDQEQNRKKQEKEEEPDLFNEGDNATVSIEALHIFLENFLRSLTETTQAPKTVASEQQIEMPFQQERQVRQPAHDSQAARAASAYQTTAQSNRQQTVSDSAPSYNPAIGLESHEVRTIHSLLSSLETLSNQNVQHLRIERGESFLQSIVEAVKKAKTA